jgi:hypothetical protein
VRVRVRTQRATVGRLTKKQTSKKIEKRTPQTRRLKATGAVIIFSINVAISSKMSAPADIFHRRNKSQILFIGSRVFPTPTSRSELIPRHLRFFAATYRAGVSTFIGNLSRHMSSQYFSEECLSVVVPAYNEENTLERVVEKLLRLPRLLEIIIIDDCSDDQTNQIATRLASQIKRVRVHRMPKNGGKTEALKSGFAMTSGQLVIVQDADLEYDPEEIPDLMQPILDGTADVVFGSRFLVRKASRALYFYHYLANKGLTFFSNCLTNINLSDVETGYKIFRGEIIRNMIISSRGFGFEIEVTAKISKLKCRIYEVPISYYGRTYEEGKKIALYDGIEAFWFIIKYNLFCDLSSSFRSPSNTTIRSITDLYEAV